MHQQEATLQQYKEFLEQEGFRHNTYVSFSSQTLLYLTSTISLSDTLPSLHKLAPSWEIDWHLARGSRSRFLYSFFFC